MGLRIEDISARTKINAAFLRALETGHFEALPGHFFTRAFLKTYAREVGLSPDEVVREFDLIRGSAVPVAVAEPTSRRDEVQRDFIEGPLSSFHLPQYGWPLALAACILIVVVALAKRQDAPAQTPAPIGTSGVATPTPAPAPVTEPAAETPDSLTIQIHATETVWVAATADGASAVYRLVRPGEKLTVTGRVMSFRIGNAAAFVYSINGASGKPLGKSGEVREVRITTDNYREFLR
jgi:cytoskeletal protein RodZ